MAPNRNCGDSAHLVCTSAARTGKEVAHRTADELFDVHGVEFGAALAGYQGHVHRVIELVGTWVELTQREAIVLGVGAFFHDSGIWLNSTFDYLAPSVVRAANHIGEHAPSDVELVTAIISEHHRVRPTRSPAAIVEAFRRADLTDVSFGAVAMPGTTRAQYRSLLAKYPSSGFRRGLAAVSVRWVVRHPNRPLPMLKW
ncbi:MAG: hypothetical protein V3V01_03455 [Acidimicrobiales bacterium]